MRAAAAVPRPTQVTPATRVAGPCDVRAGAWRASSVNGNQIKRGDLIRHLDRVWEVCMVPTTRVAAPLVCLTLGVTA